MLVQDLGLVRLIRAICPELPIHASTQMTMTSAETIAAVVESLGIERVVLARELSIDEIGGHRAGPPRCRARSSSTARYAWPIRGNA